MRNSDTERLIIPKTDVDRLFTRDELLTIGKCDRYMAAFAKQVADENENGSGYEDRHIYENDVLIGAMREFASRSVTLIETLDVDWLLRQHLVERRTLYIVLGRVLSDGGVMEELSHRLFSDQELLELGRCDSFIHGLILDMDEREERPVCQAIKELRTIGMMQALVSIVYDLSKEGNLDELKQSGRLEQKTLDIILERLQIESNAVENNEQKEAING